MTDLRFHALPDDRIIAYRFTPGTGPALVFLPGYMSDMAGGKATAVFDAARAAGRPCLLLDYSGCGESPGFFEHGSLSCWKEEVLALIAALALDEVVLIGSSMGGWLMLLVALAIPGKVKGLIGIAAAPDFTDWGVAQMDKALLAEGETIWEDNPYGPEPTPTHALFWADGQRNLLLGAQIPIDCPVHLLHGQCDPDVPWELSVQLEDTLRSDAVQVTLIKDGDHRLSRPQDIAQLLGAVDAMLAALTGKA